MESASRREVFSRRYGADMGANPLSEKRQNTVRPSLDTLFRISYLPFIRRTTVSHKSTLRPPTTLPPPRHTARLPANDPLLPRSPETLVICRTETGGMGARVASVQELGNGRCAVEEGMGDVEWWGGAADGIGGRGFVG